MFFVKTPLRISFTGGMTDFPQFFNTHSGSVISVTIDKYVRIMLNPKFEKGFRLMYSKTENVKSVKDIEHKLFKETIKYFKLNDIEIASVGDIPSLGTGLGSSASFLVGLIRLLNKQKNNKNINKGALASLAFHIENNLAKMSCGYQDHFASSYCGLNNYIFNKNKTIVKKINLSNEFLGSFEKSIKLFYLNKTSKSHGITNKNIKLLKKKDNLSYLLEILDITKESKKHLLKENLVNFSKMIDKSWELKKRYQESFIDYYDCNKFIEYAKQKGAYCGKLLGAGKRGFVMIIGPSKVLSNIANDSKLKSISPKFVMKSEPILNI